jgi:hypothetical protein
MFCPQCNAEYRVGFVRCSHCDGEVVEHLPADGSSPGTEVPGGFADYPLQSEPELVVIRTYQRGVDADLAKSVLETAGILSMIRGDDGRRYYYGYGLALKTGIERLVRAEDAEDAEMILDVDVNDEAGEPTD